MLMNYWLLNYMPASIWRENVNKKMKNYFRVRYGHILSDYEIDEHDTIPEKSFMAEIWQNKPNARQEFLDFILKS